MLLWVKELEVESSENLVVWTQGAGVKLITHLHFSTTIIRPRVPIEHPENTTRYLFAHQVFAGCPPRAHSEIPRNTAMGMETDPPPRNSLVMEERQQATKRKKQVTDWLCGPVHTCLPNMH